MKFLLYWVITSCSKHHKTSEDPENFAYTSLFRLLYNFMPVSCLASPIHCKPLEDRECLKFQKPDVQFLNRHVVYLKLM